MAITRFKNSSIANNTPKYDQMLAGLPYIPIIGTATDGGTGSTVSVGFTGNNVANGTITYTALSTPGSLTATGTSSPITVTGLTAGTAYTFQVKAGNSLGDSAYSAASNSITPVTPSSFESIATATGTGSSGTITFSSIPSTYKHLQIRYTGKRSTSAISTAAVNLQFNSDTGTSYIAHFLSGNGTAAAAGDTGAYTSIYLDNSITNNDASLSNMNGVGIIDIHDYASTTKNKTVRAFYGSNANSTSTEFRVVLRSGLWINTSAITSITLSTDSGNFTTSTQFALYGIKG